MSAKLLRNVRHSNIVVHIQIYVCTPRFLADFLAKSAGGGTELAIDYYFEHNQSHERALVPLRFTHLQKNK
jgi:hypothetical protein